MDAKKGPGHMGGYAGRGKLRQSGTTSVRPYPLCWIMQGRTLLKWGRSPFGDLFVCAKHLFIAACWAEDIVSRQDGSLGGETGAA